ncbi:MAG: hypothetical protein RID91_16065 [Azospirillaceae bacterium]
MTKRFFGPRDAQAILVAEGAGTIDSDGTSVGDAVALDLAEAGLFAAVINIEAIADASDEATYVFKLQATNDDQSTVEEIARLTVTNRNGDLDAVDGDQLHLVVDGESARKAIGFAATKVRLDVDLGGNAGEDVAFNAFLAPALR